MKNFLLHSLDGDTLKKKDLKSQRSNEWSQNCILRGSYTIVFQKSDDSPSRSICLWFSSMWSWMSGWDPTTRIYVPTHPSNHMKLFTKPIGTCDKNLASWFELYRICFVTGLASRFLRFSSSSTFVCLVVFWKKEIDGDLAMKMSDHWDTLEHTWCVPAILNSRI